MDRWKWFSLSRKYHLIDNPTSEAKIDQLVEVLGRVRKARVLDIASGNAELLCRMAARHGSRGVGVEISPYRHANAVDRVRQRGLDGLITLVHGRGQDYQTTDGSFDVACCVGATWIFGGYDGTLRALNRIVATDGTVVVGEPFWKMDPPAEFEAETADQRVAFGSHRSNTQAGKNLASSWSIRLPAAQTTGISMNPWRGRPLTNT